MVVPQQKRLENAAEPFPAYTETEAAIPRTQDGCTSPVQGFFRRRTMSLLDADIPRGMSGMTGIAAGQAPTLAEVRQGALMADETERRRQFSTGGTPLESSPRRPTKTKATNGLEPIATATTGERLSLSNDAANGAIASETVGSKVPNPMESSDTTTSIERVETVVDKTDEDVRPNHLVSHPTIYDLERTESGAFPNGYRFPPKHTWKEATAIGFRAFLKFTFGSWVGFLIVFYCVQVIGWGGMIFLLLCTAGDPRMCWLEKPPGSGNWVTDCNDKHTSKSLWIEIDAQVLTGLFCVTAFGLAPWRCRDLWYLMQYRIWHEHLALRKLAAAHKGWFRLPGSHHLDPSVKATDLVPGRDDEAINLLPHPLEKAPPPPWTAIRALPTKVWKMDFVVWMMFGNTIFQVILCGFMWGQTRYVRAAWTTALFIVLGMLSGIAAGWIQFTESRNIKRREGVPIESATQDNGLESGSVVIGKEKEKSSETV
jgi:hypothetical protein